MSTILVTGGAGFIGSNFVRHWLAHHANDRIVNYDLLTYAACPANLDDVVEREGNRYAFVQGDIRDYDLALATIRRHAVDVIVNFAAESHNSRAVVQPEAFFTTNVVGTVQLMRAALEAGVSRFHHISTCEVYGDIPLDADDAFIESSPLVPKTPYNASKAAADLAVNAFSETYGLPVTISNCANNYGPYQFPEKVIPHFVVSVLNGKPMTLYRSSRKPTRVAACRRSLPGNRDHHRARPPWRDVQRGHRSRTGHRRYRRPDPDDPRCRPRLEILRPGPSRPRPALPSRLVEDPRGVGVAASYRFRGGL